MYAYDCKECPEGFYCDNAIEPVVNYTMYECIEGECMEYSPDLTHQEFNVLCWGHTQVITVRMVLSQPVNSLVLPELSIMEADFVLLMNAWIVWVSARTGVLFMTS